MAVLAFAAFLLVIAVFLVCALPKGQGAQP
ncbi:hypothetical protein GGQ67_004675 [Rhizobium metallidurans]|uniref:Uncharacterized protein n=1 Tax=Rhizobium metallidurans TaxID=1265931 RepID=A0A7W6CY42_9HYPH|nr:hypothetical protein [Rhizobium metallidurans]